VCEHNFIKKVRLKKNTNKKFIMPQPKAFPNSYIWIRLVKQPGPARILPWNVQVWFEHSAPTDSGDIRKELEKTKKKSSI
jgi:hypothetical protein